MAKKKTKPGYFRENWKLLTALLLPLALCLGGIILLIMYEYSYTFRVAWDKEWRAFMYGTSTPDDGGKTVAIVPNVPSYSQEHVAECNAMPDKYILSEPGADNPIDLNPAIGLQPGANAEEVAQRCKDFAKTVAKMETLSQHRHYAFLCPGVRFSVGKGFGFIADPKGGAVILDSTDPAAKTVRIPLPVGEQTVYRQWQFYNIGDGCVIMGYSSRRSRTLEVDSR
jgi:hypothetical protein